MCMKDRRTEPRVLCADMVDVSWREGSRRRRAMGLLEDISESGACFQMESPVPVGAELEWRCPGGDFKGIVRYCVYREIGYFAGIQFSPGCRWSRRIYRPQHLLDPARLAAALRD